MRTALVALTALLAAAHCHNQGRPAVERYTAMAKALAATGRDIVYSICEWGANKPWEWAAEVGGHYWRTTGDISDRWGSVVSILDQQVGLEAYSGPNAWHDPDMLEVGNGGMTTEEYRAHMSLWSKFTVTAPATAPNGTYALTADVRHRGGRLPGYGAVSIATRPVGTPWLSDLAPVSAQVGWGSLGVDESVDGNPLRIAGATHAKGVAPHAASEVTYYLGEHRTRFTAGAGIDDETRDRGSVTFTVLGDGRVLAETGVVLGGQPAVAVAVDVTGVTELVLVTGVGPDNNNHDHSEWVDPKLTCEGV